jgi:acetylornithine deacetylase
MKNLSPAELAVVANVDRDRVADDLAALVAIRSLTGEEGAVQTEVALRMTTAGLDVERVDTPAIELAADPDFPGVEVPRDVHPVVSGRLTGDAAGRRVLIAGHIDVVAGGDELAWTSPRSSRGSPTACCSAGARAT